MNRSELEHIIRASSAITNQKQIAIIGSQSILGSYPNAHPRLLVSMEADVFPLNQPELSDQIDGAIGERSAFHQTFGYYAHGVSDTTAVLPTNWRSRLVVIENENTGGGAGLCLEPHDLVASKLVAGREKDLEFVTALFDEQMIHRAVVEERLRLLPLPPDQLSSVISRLHRIKSTEG